MSDEYTPVSNRSEIVFITDAEDCNPNGNPLSENRPRVDPVTDQAVVTDVRLKRYLRDQLDADGHPIFVKKTGEGDSAVRAALALDLFEEVEEPDDFDEIDDIRREFLDRATDIRYFGATLSFNKDPEDELYKAVKQRFPSEFTGPVQFSPARSLNRVELNEESNTLTSVIATQEDKTTGGFDLDDHRLKFAIFPFHGLVDEHGAEDTRLSQRDVERLDSLCWRSIKNQTISRSKVGQEPRLYTRVESVQEGFHIGGLHHGFELDDRHRNPDSELPLDSEIRNVNGVCLDVSGFVSRIEANVDRIDTVHFLGSDYLTISLDGETVGVASDIPDLLPDAVSVRRIDPYTEAEKTFPTEDGAAR
jgi:CRISPR-associated protein Csh2